MDHLSSDYYRALLIDFPNAEDRAQFTRARRSGDLPASAQSRRADRNPRQRRPRERLDQRLRRRHERGDGRPVPQGRRGHPRDHHRQRHAMDRSPTSSGETGGMRQMAETEPGAAALPPAGAAVHAARGRAGRSVAAADRSLRRHASLGMDRGGRRRAPRRRRVGRHRIPLPAVRRRTRPPVGPGAQERPRTEAAGLAPRPPIARARGAPEGRRTPRRLHRHRPDPEPDLPEEGRRRRCSTRRARPGRGWC